MKIAGIERNSVVDGEGWRYTIFFQGCLHKCKGCHNPETWTFNSTNNMTVQDILKDLNDFDPDKFYDVTFSGGDPFFQATDVIELAKALKAEGRSIWAYTGFKFDKFIEYIKSRVPSTKTSFTDSDKPEVTNSMIELLQYIDVVVDGKFELENRTVDLVYRGSTNQRLINVKKSLENKDIVIYDIE